MTIFLYPFLILAGLGFILSLLVHLLAMFGVELPQEVFVLHGGIFVVWIPAVLVSNFTHHHPRHHFGWKDSLHGCPRWMRIAVYGLFAYVFLNFFLFIAGIFGPNASAVIRGFSGHWMLFYAVAFATLYSALLASRPLHLNDSHPNP